MIDLSHRIDESTPVYPGDPALEVTILDSTSEAASGNHRRLNCSQIHLGLHCGTHLDAPYHFFGDAATIDEVPLEHCVGPATLVRITGRTIGPELLRPHEARIRSARRVVLNTGWHKRWKEPEYFAEHPVVTGAAARWLVDCGVVLVGVDTPSVDRPPFDAHLELLGHGVLILENLTNLDAIEAETFMLSALPLKVGGRDGSPVRAVAWTRERGEA